MLFKGWYDGSCLSGFCMNFVRKENRCETSTGLSISKSRRRVLLLGPCLVLSAKKQDNSVGPGHRPLPLHIHWLAPRYYWLFDLSTYTGTSVFRFCERTGGRKLPRPQWLHTMKINTGNPDTRTNNTLITGQPKERKLRKEHHDQRNWNKNFWVNSALLNVNFFIQFGGSIAQW